MIIHGACIECGAPTNCADYVAAAKVLLYIDARAHCPLCGLVCLGVLRPIDITLIQHSLHYCSDHAWSVVTPNLWASFIRNRIISWTITHAYDPAPFMLPVVPDSYVEISTPDISFLTLQSFSYFHNEEIRVRGIEPAAPPESQVNPPTGLKILRCCCNMCE